NSPCWPHPHENSSEERRKCREQQYRNVDPGFVKSRNVRGSQRENCIQTPDGQQNPGDRANQSDERALNQELTRDCPSTGAERSSHRHFFRSSESARELEVRNIRASDEQNATDSREEKVQAGAVVPNRRLEQ